MGCFLGPTEEGRANGQGVGRFSLPRSLFIPRSFQESAGLREWDLCVCVVLLGAPRGNSPQEELLLEFDS